MGYKKDALKGISWLGAFRIVSRSLSFARTAIIARLLSPTQFGVFSVATLILALIETITETGINIFLIQQDEDADKYINTSWVVSICRGIFIALVILLLAFPISIFFRSPDSYLLLLLISIVPFIRGFINPSVAKFIKDLEFQKEFSYRTSIFFVETVITVLMVILLDSPLGLVFGMIAGALYEVVLSFILSKPIPRFIFDGKLFRHVLHKGKWLTAVSIFSYLYQNLDNISVGRILGTSALGLYDMAYKISIIPITEVSDVINRALFPVLVKMNTDKERMWNAFKKSLAGTILITLPMSAIFFFFPELLIQILLGSNWMEVAPILKILALFGIFRAIGLMMNNLLIAINRQDIVSGITLINVTILSVSLLPLISRFGMQGAAYAAFLATLCSLPFSFYFIYKYLLK